jgi:hypothetical protein
MSDETFKIPVAPKQRLYPLTVCSVGIVWEREEIRIIVMKY